MMKNDDKSMTNGEKHGKTMEAMKNDEKQLKTVKTVKNDENYEKR